MACNRLLRILRPVSLLFVIGIGLSGCASDWPAFRHNILRSAHQLNVTALSDPVSLPTLHIGSGWPFQPPGALAFRASPIVYNGRVYIGNGNGRLYALDAVTGALLWQYPPLASPPLTSTLTCNPSSVGIASSAAIAHIGGTDAVIFGAPDQSAPGSGLGEGRLFALNAATGAVIWKSPVIAQLTSGDTHEQIGYSSPLIFSNRVYIGIADHCDNPIQRGKVVAVRLDTGAIEGAFSFVSTGPPRGGGVWSSVAAWIGGLYVTTGNVNVGGPEPVPNHGLSLLRLDPSTGSVIWKHQPVPYILDGDPDWSAGATVMLASCGTLIASTMKDGWTHAVNAGDGTLGLPSAQWVFPPATIPFTPGDGTTHGDIRYLRPGAAWGDVYITMTGGLNVTTNVTSGYRRLHALNACASSVDRIRWMIDVPGASGTYALGPPTVSRGMVFVGTSSGRLVVIADPSIWPGAGWRCSNPDVLNANCLASGFTFVPEPSVLANIQLDGQILTEPALANGRVYVATNAGKLYMLEP